MPTRKSKSKPKARARATPAAPKVPRVKSDQAADAPARGSYVVQPQDPEGAEVATGRYTVQPGPRTAE